METKHLILFAVYAVLLFACSQYPNKEFLCKGSTTLQGTKDKNQEIGMRLENDRITFTGNNLISLYSYNVCKIGGSVTNDEIHFDSNECGSTEKRISRNNGTYNFITKILTIVNVNNGSVFIGDYSCEEVK